MKRGAIQDSEFGTQKNTDYLLLKTKNNKIQQFKNIKKEKMTTNM